MNNDYDKLDFCGVLCNYAEEQINKYKNEALEDFATNLKCAPTSTIAKHKVDEVLKLSINKNLTSIDNWVSVKDSLPTNTERVFVCVQHKGGSRYITTDTYDIYCEEWIHLSAENDSNFKITHWRPILISLPNFDNIEDWDSY